MGRKNVIPELETKIGQQLKPWLANKIREGKTPEEISKELGIGKSKIYILIKDFNLKSIQKEVKKAQETGTENELKHHLNTYLQEKKTAGLSSKTIKDDEEMWRVFCWWLEYAQKPLNLATLLNPDEITQFCTFLSTSKKRPGGETKRVAGQVTIRNYQKRMAAFIHWLQKREIISQEKKTDPFTKMRKPKIPKKLPEDIPDPILKMALGSFDNSFEGIRDKAITMWFIETGMRLGGVTGMKMNRFDWEKGVGRVTEKGNKERTIVLSDKLKVQMKQYLAVREPRVKSLDIWIDAAGKPLSDMGIYKLTAKLNDIPGVREEFERLAPGNRFHPHAYRHVWAKHLALSEVPAFAMMVMGGWDDIALVQHYAAAYGQEKAWSYINKASPLSNIV